MKGDDTAKINMLPWEVLSKIFLTARTLAKDPRSMQEQLCRLTTICSYWHKVSLNTPTLWNFISIIRDDQVRWGQRLLELSRGANLFVAPERMSNFYDKVGRFYLDMLNNNMSRIAVLRIALSARNMPEMIAYLSKSCLSLEELSLGYIKDRTGHQYYVLPSRFLARQAPPLRRLSLQFVENIDWALPLFTSLTSLELSYCVIAKPHFTQFFEMLQRTQALERLTIQKGVDERDSKDVAANFQQTGLQYPMVYLRQLKELSVSAPESTAMPLLFRLSFPASARFHAMVTCSENTGCLDLLRHLKGHLAEASSQRCLSAARIDIYDNDTFQMRWYTNPCNMPNPASVEICYDLYQDTHAHACIYLRGQNGILPKEIIDVVTAGARR